MKRAKTSARNLFIRERVPERAPLSQVLAIRVADRRAAGLGHALLDAFDGHLAPELFVDLVQELRGHVHALAAWEAHVASRVPHAGREATSGAAESNGRAADDHVNRGGAFAAGEVSPHVKIEVLFHDAKGRPFRRRAGGRGRGGGAYHLMSIRRSVSLASTFPAVLTEHLVDVGRHPALGLQDFPIEAIVDFEAAIGLEHRFLHVGLLHGVPERRHRKS